MKLSLISSLKILSNKLRLLTEIVTRDLWQIRAIIYDVFIFSKIIGTFYDKTIFSFTSPMGSHRTLNTHYQIHYGWRNTWSCELIYVLKWSYNFIHLKNSKKNILKRSSSMKVFTINYDNFSNFLKGFTHDKKTFFLYDISKVKHNSYYKSKISVSYTHLTLPTICSV